MDRSLKLKLDALRRMTTARGCSEAEALAAAEKAAQLMREHGLTDADLEFSDEVVATRSKGAAVRDDLWSAVSVVTNTAMIWTDTLGRRQIVFVGREPGPQIAAYLHQVMNRALDGALRDYRATRSYRSRRSLRSRRLAVDEFTIAMVSRLIIRLGELFAEARSREALQAARQELNRRFPAATTVVKREKKFGRPSAASDAGWQAGGKVALAHGVDDNAPLSKSLAQA